MRTNWQTKKLGEIIKLEYGKPLSDAKRNSEGAYPVYGANGVKSRTDEYFYNQQSIIIGRKGSAGEINLTEEKFWPLDVTYFVTFDHEKYSVKFLYYLLSNLELPKLAKGVKPGINRNEVYSIPVKIPLLSEQQRIVSIVDKAFLAIDKAEFNAEQNLKKAKSLFDSYLQNIFEKRDDRWDEKRLGDLCDLITCGVAATPKYVDENVGIPFLSAQNVRDGKVVLDKYRFISKELHRELTKKNKPSKGDILYSRVGAKFGEAGVVEHDFEFSVYVSLTLIKSKPDKLNNYYLKYYLNSPIMKSIAKKSISSSGVPNLNVKDVREFPINLPPIAVQEQIVNQIKSVSIEAERLVTIYRNYSPPQRWHLNKFSSESHLNRN